VGKKGVRIGKRKCDGLVFHPRQWGREIRPGGKGHTLWFHWGGVTTGECHAAMSNGRGSNNVFQNAPERRNLGVRNPKETV